MSTLAELRQGPLIEFGYLLVIEGLPYAWTNVDELTGNYLGSDRTVLRGLKVPDSITVSVSPRGGMLEDDRVTFAIDDIDGVMDSLFKPQVAGETKRVTQRIKASDTGGTLSAVQTAGFGSLDLASKHLGIEYISSTRTRRSRYITPTDTPPGFEHFTPPASELGSGKPPVFASDRPLTFAGRRVALYRCIKNQETDTWDSWTAQYNSGGMIWYGTMAGRGRIVDLHTWEIECAGPRSWVSKRLNASNPEGPFSVRPALDIADSKRGVAIVFITQETQATTGGGYTGLLSTYHKSSVFDTTYDLTGDAVGGANGWRQQIADLIDDVVNGTNANVTTGLTAFQEADEEQIADASMSQDGVRIKRIDNVAATYYGEMQIILHRDVWIALGWDPDVQSVLSTKDDKYCQFFDFDFGDALFAPTFGDPYSIRGDETIGPDGYIVGKFTTIGFVNGGDYFDGVDLDNGGAERVWLSAYGTDVFSLAAQGNQRITIGGTSVTDGTSVLGQYARPIASTLQTTPTVGGGTPDRMGWIWFSGQIVRGVDPFGDNSAEEINQVARVCWRSSGDSITTNSGGSGVAMPEVLIEKWEDPRAFGFDNEKLSGDWVVGGTLRCEGRFLAVFGGYREDPAILDEAHRVMTRIMLSSGTVGAWGTSFPWTVPTFGSNQPSGSLGVEAFAGDTERADMGLCVPKECVDFSSFLTEAQALPQGVASPLNAVKYAYAGPVSADDLLGQILSGRAWAFSWRRDSGQTQPRFGIFSPYSEVGATDVQIAITASDLAGDSRNVRSWRPQQALSVATPIDVFELELRQTPAEDFQHEGTVQPADPGSIHRSGRASYPVRDGGAPKPDLAAAIGAFGWGGDFYERFANGVAGFFAQQNYRVTFAVSHTKGQFIGPGSILSLSHEWMHSPDGTLGLTGGLVTVLGCEYRLGDGATVVTGVLHSKTIDGDGAKRLWAPSAFSTDYDSGTSTLTCEQDWLGIGHGSTDVAFFVEPAAYSNGGTVKLKIYQSPDGRDWTTWTAATANLSSVDTDNDQIVLTSVSGTIYRDSYKLILLDDYDAHTAGAWPREILQVLCEDQDGTFVGSPTNGWEL